MSTLLDIGLPATVQSNEQRTGAISGNTDESRENCNNQGIYKVNQLPWFQMLGSFCLNMNTWGLLSSFGVFQTHYSLKLLSVYSDSKISWIGSSQAFAMFLGSFLIGPTFDAGHLHSLLLVGTLLSLLGWFMTSICKTYWQLILAQGVTMGAGFGCLYLPAPALIFQTTPSLVMGISSSGSGIGAVVFPLVFNHLEPRIGFEWTTRTFGFIILATSILPLTVMRFPEGYKHASRIRNASRRKRSIQSPILWTRSLIDKSALRDWPFILLVIGSLTTFMGIYVMLYYVNLLSKERMHVPDIIAFQSLTIVNSASTIGRILPSALADHVGPVHILVVTALLSGLLVFCSFAVQGTASLIVWAIAFGSSSGAFMGLPTAGIVSISNSTDNIGKRLGMTLGIVGFGVLFAGPIAGAILGMHGGGWVGMIGWSASLMIVGCILIFIGRALRTGTVLLVKM